MGHTLGLTMPAAKMARVRREQAEFDRVQRERSLTTAKIRELTVLSREEGLTKQKKEAILLAIYFLRNSTSGIVKQALDAVSKDRAQFMNSALSS